MRGLDGNNTVDQNFADSVLGARESEPARRWHHYATVYDPTVGLRQYVDGRCLTERSENAFTNDGPSDGAVFYLGAKSTDTTIPFRGALDEVKIFATALSERQIHALMRVDAGGVRVLPEGDAVTIAEGATLEVDGTKETLATLAGSGTFSLTSGTVCLTNGVSQFDGALKGKGTLCLAEGASLTLAQSPADFSGVVEMAGGAFSAPKGAEAIPATFRLLTLDGAQEVSYPGSIEIPDGTAITLAEGVKGPLVTAQGAVTICGGGTVTLPSPKARGVWVLARGASIADQGTTDLNTRWTVTNLEGDHKATFRVTESGDFICGVIGRGMFIICR